jgi:hypothetical protein
MIISQENLDIKMMLCMHTQKKKNNKINKKLKNKIMINKKTYGVVK